MVDFLISLINVVSKLPTSSPSNAVKIKRKDSKKGHKNVACTIKKILGF
jgi:hypothetical protein